MLAVQQNEGALNYASKKLKGDQDILALLEQQDIKTLSPTEIAEGIEPTKNGIEQGKTEIIKLDRVRQGSNGSYVILNNSIAQERLETLEEKFEEPLKDGVEPYDE